MTPPQRILIVRRRYLGDLVLLDPMLRILRTQFPDAFIALLVDEGYGDVLASHPALDRILEIPMRREKESLFSFAVRYLEVGHTLRGLHFDTSLNYQPQLRVAGLLAMAHIPQRIGFKLHRGFFLAPTNIPVDREELFFYEAHASRANLAFLEALSIPIPEEYECLFHIPPQAQNEADALLAKLLGSSTKPFVLVHPGGRVPCRRWPTADFAQVMAALKQSGRADLLLTCGPHEEELLAEINTLIPGGVPILPTLPLTQFAAVARRAAVYLGNDTGSAHVAAASGTRTVILFGTQLVAAWHPLGKGHRALQSPQPCPCPTPELCHPTNSYRNYCVRMIPPQEVLDAVCACLDEASETDKTAKKPSLPLPIPPTFTATIAIATYNRCKWLEQTLASLAAHKHNLPSLEVLIIDNNSTDETRAVCDAIVPAHPTWRTILETEQGLDHARNRAIREAHGEFLVYIDDDVLLQEGWLDALLEPWLNPEKKNEAIAAIGGTVIPVFPEGCPPWLKNWATTLHFGSFENHDPIRLTQYQMPMGTNLAFRRSVFERTGLFRSDLGRKGNNIFAGDESEMLKRIHREGLEVWFAPQAVLHHQFPRARLNFKYTFRHGFDSARSRVIEIAGDPRLSRFRRIAFCLSRFAVNLGKGAVLILSAIGQTLFFRLDGARQTLIRLARCGGYIYQAARSLPRAAR